MNINNMVIEITRKCNMVCDHCLRGNAQNIEIPDHVINQFFHEMRNGYIDNLTITGGEPSLAPHKINTIIEAAKHNHVDIGSFYIATNAKEVSDEFLLAVMRLHCYCSDNELSAVNYSNDDYHDPIKTENIKRLSVFSFTSPKYDRSYPLHDYEINEGRAKENGIGCRENHESLYDDFENYIDLENQTIYEMTVYLNCKGKVINGCDWSYKSQNKKANIICGIENFSMEAFEAYVEKHCKG